MGIIKDGGEFSLRVSSCRTAHAELFSAFEYGDVLTYELTVNDGALTESNFLYLRRDDDGEVFFIPGFRRDGRCVFTLHTDEICSDVQKRGLFFCAFELGGRPDSVRALSWEERTTPPAAFSFRSTLPEPTARRDMRAGSSIRSFPTASAEGRGAFPRKAPSWRRTGTRRSPNTPEDPESL